MPRIIEDCKNQTVDLDIHVINNGEPIELDATVHQYDNSAKCWQRWLFAAKVKTPYLFVMDDDLTFGTPHELSKCLSYLFAHPNINCVGYTGVKYNGRYFGSPHFSGVSTPFDVDIVKGRFMFMRTKALKGLDLEPDLTCDDIKVSAHIKGKRVIPLKFENLKEGPEAVFLQKGQKEKREIACKKYL